ncbi:MAG: hypothetical protein WC356_01310 [Candidatus Micrarchaeia archaeon]|jgi:competence protein ComGC
MKTIKSMNLYEILFILVISVSILFVIFIGIQKTETIKQNKEIDNLTINNIECFENETKDCITINNCDGVIYCRNGKWTNCYKNKVICVPNSSTTCALTPCSAGIKICNECGTEWGECE